MLRLVLVVGLLAGLTAGLATAALQHFTTVPLILAAETHLPGGGYEPSPAEAHGTEAAESPGARTLSTFGATVVSAIGFALVLIAVMLIAGEAITPLSALAYAAAGFAATGLATGLGLAPELPGSAAADLIARQGWWVFTAIATAAGIYALLKLRTPMAVGAGIVLLALPHMIGAPEPLEYFSTAPAELAAHFASTSLVMHGVFWALVGAAVGLFWKRLSPAT